MGFYIYTDTWFYQKAQKGKMKSETNFPMIQLEATTTF